MRKPIIALCLLCLILGLSGCGKYDAQPWPLAPIDHAQVKAVEFVHYFNYNTVGLYPLQDSHAQALIAMLNDIRAAGYQIEPAPQDHHRYRVELQDGTVYLVDTGEEQNQVTVNGHLVTCDSLRMVQRLWWLLQDLRYDLTAAEQAGLIQECPEGTVPLTVPAGGMR